MPRRSHQHFDNYVVARSVVAAAPRYRADGHFTVESLGGGRADVVNRVPRTTGFGNDSAHGFRRGREPVPPAVRKNDLSRWRDRDEAQRPHVCAERVQGETGHQRDSHPYGNHRLHFLVASGFERNDRFEIGDPAGLLPDCQEAGGRV